MTLEDLGNIGEFVAAIGVIVSLVYLATQIRQNTKAVRSSASQAIAETRADFLKSIQYWDGLLDRDVWESRARSLTEVFAQPGVTEWWGKNGHLYSTRFQEEVAKLLAA
jgi:hypothetical protein